MKILIAYDGSACADAAVEDLARAGFPDDIEALVVTVSEIWLPGVVEEGESGTGADERPAAVKHLRTHAAQELHAVHQVALQGVDRVQAMFPGWRVNAQTRADTPAWGVLEVAREWEPDIIVVGSHGRSALGRIILGSVSLKILSEANCSVRIARCHRPIDHSPVRIIIGLDGSPDSQAAVTAVASRKWMPGSAARVVGVLESKQPAVAPPIGSHVPVGMVDAPADAREQWTRVLDEAIGTLRAAGLHADAMTGEGTPDRVMLGVADEWGADAIVVGARGHRFLERMLIGSVSSALATHAHCSVEVVRPR